MLQLVIVGQGRAVGIEQSVGALVAVHLEAAVGRGEDAFLVAIAAVESWSVTRSRASYKFSRIAFPASDNEEAKLLIFAAPAFI